MNGDLASTLGRQRTRWWESALALAFGHALEWIRKNYAMLNKALAVDHIRSFGCWFLCAILRRKRSLAHAMCLAQRLLPEAS